MQTLHIFDKLGKKLQLLTNASGGFMVDVFHYLALFAIGITIAISAFQYFIHIFGQSSIKVDDILMLFIYLELGAMVGIYFKTHRMPVRYLIYVAITALTRLMISDISNHQINVGILIISGGILMLALSVVVVQYASSRFRSQDEDTDG